MPLSMVSMKNWLSNSPGVESKGILGIVLNTETFSYLTNKSLPRFLSKKDTDKLRTYVEEGINLHQAQLCPIQQ